MSYTPLNLDVYTAAYAGAIAGIGIPQGAFIIDPVEADYAPVAAIAAAFAQAFDIAWSATPTANLYDVQAITDAVCNTFVKGPGYPFTGAVTTRENWAVTATAIVALIKEGDARAVIDGITFPPVSGGGGGPVPQQYWIAPWGSDTTGTGSIFLPFKTIAHTQSVITDAAINKVYEMICYPGEYAEDVSLKAFTEIVGFDPTQTFNQSYPARINGTVGIGTGFGVASASAWLTNLDIDGATDLNLVEAGAGINSGVSITNCQLEDDMTVNLDQSHFIELHGSTLFGGYEQTGGAGLWENTAGAGIGLLSVLAASGSIPTLKMINSNWDGDAAFNQNGITTGGMTITLDNSQIREGTVTVTAAGAFCPNINGSFGSLPENVVLTGSSATAMSRQMRISQGLTVTGVGTLAVGETDINIPLTDGFFGQTSIEQLACSLTFIGTNWTSLANLQITWSWYVKRNSTVNEVHLVLYNHDVETTIPDLPLLLTAYFPNTYGV